MTLKIVNDANDVIDEMTRDGGKSMWTQTSWDGYVPRLNKWMSLWEETGARHGLSPDAGQLLGGHKPGIADVITATLWTTLTDRFPKIRRILDETAPATAALCRRISALPPLANLAAKARQDYGDVWCGGEIEASLRKVMG
jgi:glutathione S-transferase